MKQFSILITTKNRIEDLKFTLQKINYLIEDERVETIICDDGSTDNTYNFIKKQYPKIKLLKNQKSKGLIYSRNLLLNKTTAKYAISLDDDAHFESENILNKIEKHFRNNPNCGVIACRIFWGKQLPTQLNSNEITQKVKGFVGCGHVWNLKAWHNIPNYPSWFVFYGEEDFAAFQLFKKGWEVNYVPSILVQHRVHIKSRKKAADYQLRLRRSLRSGWYLYLLFYPKKTIPKRFLYTVWVQLKKKVFKGDFKAFLAILQAFLDVLLQLPKLVKNANRLTNQEFDLFLKINGTKTYWKP